MQIPNFNAFMKKWSPRGDISSAFTGPCSQRYLSTDEREVAGRGLNDADCRPDDQIRLRRLIQRIRCLL